MPAGYEGIGKAKENLEKALIEERGERKKRSDEERHKLATMLLAKGLEEQADTISKGGGKAPGRLPEVPCAPFDKVDPYLEQFFQQVAKLPETQMLEVTASDNNAKENATILSKNASFLAKSMDPLDKAEIGDKTVTGEDSWRKTYDVTLDREGPLYSRSARIFTFCFDARYF